MRTWSDTSTPSSHFPEVLKAWEVADVVCNISQVEWTSSFKVSKMLKPTSKTCWREAFHEMVEHKFEKNLIWFTKKKSKESRGTEALWLFPIPFFLKKLDILLRCHASASLLQWRDVYEGISASHPGVDLNPIPGILWTFNEVEIWHTYDTS